MTSSKLYFIVYKIIYIWLFILLAISAANDISKKKQITLHFISIILFIISLALEVFMVHNSKKIYYMPSGILLIIGLSLQAYYHYENDKSYTEKVKFIILLIGIFLLVTIYAIYNNQVVYY